MMTRIPSSPPMPNTVFTLPALMGGDTELGGPGTSGAPRPGCSGGGAAEAASAAGGTGAGCGSGGDRAGLPPPRVFCGTPPPLSARPLICVVVLAHPPAELTTGHGGTPVLATARLVPLQGSSAVGTFLLCDTAADQGLGARRPLEGPVLREGPIGFLAADGEDLLAGLVVDLVVHGAGVDANGDLVKVLVVGGAGDVHSLDEEILQDVLLVLGCHLVDLRLPALVEARAHVGAPLVDVAVLPRLLQLKNCCLTPIKKSLLFEAGVVARDLGDPRRWVGGAVAGGGRRGVAGLVGREPAHSRTDHGVVDDRQDDDQADDAEGASASAAEEQGEEEEAASSAAATAEAATATAEPAPAAARVTAPTPPRPLHAR